ncbi:MAG: hypothetical protein M3332_13980, partial [Actinomycetota bacterium]|nr:hypothetical protein [Actinomycetota bacterium]
TEQEAIGWVWRICTGIGVLRDAPTAEPTGDSGRQASRVGTLARLPASKRRLLRALVVAVKGAHWVRNEVRALRNRSSAHRGTTEPR